MSLEPPSDEIALVVWVSGAVFVTLLSGIVSWAVVMARARKWVSTMIEEGRKPIIGEIRNLNSTVTMLADKIGNVLLESVVHDGDLSRLKGDMHKAETTLDDHSNRITKLESARD